MYLCYKGPRLIPNKRSFRIHNNRLMQRKRENFDTVPHRSEVSIDILNDDCLLNILELLTFVEIVNVELVCKRWQRLCRQLWKSTRELVVGQNDRSICDYEFIRSGYLRPKLKPVLKLCGTNLRSLTVVYVEEYNVLELITQYCNSALNSFTIRRCDVTDPGVEMFCAKFQSLTELELYWVEMTDKQLERIFISQPKLKCLQLDFVPTLKQPNFDKLNEGVESIFIGSCKAMSNDSIIGNLNKYKHLKKLHISTDNTLRLNDLVRAIPQIEHLRIEYYLNNNEELHEIGVLKNIRSLYLNLYDSITDNTMAALVKNCHLLEDIQFENFVNDCPVTSEGMKRLAELPKLNKIYMNSIDQINDEVLQMLASNGTPTHVNVSNCVNVTDRGVTSVLEQCLYLRELIIDGCSITKKMLRKVTRTINSTLVLHDANYP